MLILSLSYSFTNVLFIDRFILKITQGKNLHVFKVNLADQRARAENLKNIVTKLRVKDTAQSRKQKTLRFHKGPFIYYVITFWGFLDPPPPLRQHVFSTKNKQKLAFSDPPSPPASGRNI